MLFWLLLAFPTGRLGSRLDRIYIVAFFVWVGIVRPFPSAAYFDPTFEGPFDVPGNPLLVRADPDLNTAVDRWLSLVDLVFIAAMLILLVRHWRRAGRHGRRALVPVLAVSGVMVGTLLVGYRARLQIAAVADVGRAAHARRAPSRLPRRLAP